MSSPFFSIITINLNNGSGLRKTLASIKSQSFIDYELIVVDGASIDSSLDVCAEYEDLINKLISEKDNGIAHAFNKGTLAASGTIITYLNSGDVYLYDDVLLDVKNSYDFVGPWTWAYGFKKHTDHAGNIYPPRKVEVTPYKFKKFSSGDLIICHQAVFMSLDHVKQFGCYDETYQFNGMDYDLLLKFATFCDPFIIKKELVIFDSNGVGSKNYFNLLYSKHVIRSKLFKYNKIYKFYDYLRMLYKYFTGKYRSFCKHIFISNPILKKILFYYLSKCFL